MDTLQLAFGNGVYLIGLYLVIVGILVLLRYRVLSIIYFTIFYSILFLFTCPLLTLVKTELRRWYDLGGGSYGAWVINILGTKFYLFWIFLGTFYNLTWIILVWGHHRKNKGIPFIQGTTGKLWLIFSLATVLLIGTLGQYFLFLNHVSEGLYTFIIGAGLLIPVTWLFRKIPIDKKRLPFIIEIVILLIITGVGFYLRVHQIESLPPGCWFDEADNGIEALKIYSGKQYLPITTGFHPKETLYLYFIALFFKLNGINTLSMRLVSVLFGILTIPAFYLLLRNLYGKKVGLATTFLFALSHWHLFFSRIAFRAILVPLIQVLVTFYLLKALKQGKYYHYILAGILTGVGFYTYYSYPLFPILLFIFWLHHLVYHVLKIWLKKERAAWSLIKRTVVGMVLLVLAAGITGSWMFWFIYKNPDIYFKRSGQVLILNRYNKGKEKIALVNGIKSYALMFNVKGDNHSRHNYPGKPQLNFIVGLLAVLGFLSAIARFWQPFQFFSILWSVSFLVPGIITIMPPNCLRAIGTLPIAYIFTGMSISMFWQGFRHSMKLAGDILMVILTLGVIAYSYHDTYNVYFNKYPLLSQIWGNDFSYTEWSMAEEIKNNPNVRNVYYATETSNLTLKFLLTNHPVNLQKFQYLLDIPIRHRVKTDVLFFIGSPYYRDALPLLKDYYPKSVVKKVTNPKGMLLYYSVYLDKKMINSLFGIQGKFRKLIDLPGVYTYTRKDSLPTYPETKLERLVPLKTPYDAAWDGSMFLQRTGDYVLQVKSTNPLSIDIDGETIVDDFQESTTAITRSFNLMLAHGFHSFSMNYKAKTKPLILELELFLSKNGGKYSTAPAFYDIPLKNNKLKALKMNKSSIKYTLVNTIIPWTNEKNKNIFLHPRGLTMDKNGNFWIANSGAHTLLKISRDGELINTFGGEGPEPGKFKSPVDVECGPDGRIYVLDAWNGRIQVFDTNGNFITQKSGGFWGPSTLTISEHGTILVTDNGSRAIKKFSLQLNSLGLTSGSNKPGGKFFIPIAVATDDQGLIYVAESDNHRFQIIDQLGNHVNSWPIHNSGQLNSIQIITPDHILLGDASQKKITVYNSNGDLIYDSGLETVKLFFPTDFYYDGNNTLYIMDSTRILEFKITKNKP